MWEVRELKPIIPWVPLRKLAALAVSVSFQPTVPQHQCTTDWLMRPLVTPALFLAALAVREVAPSAAALPASCNKFLRLIDLVWFFMDKRVG